MPGAVAISPSVPPGVPYDPLRDFEPVTQLVNSATAFVGNATALFTYSDLDCSACVDGILSLAKGGRHLQIGLTTKAEAGHIRLPVDFMVYNELQLIGSLGMPPHRYTSMLPLVVAHKLTRGKMVTREISLSEVEGIFKDMTRSANTGTFVVTQFR